ncbi:MAG: hypothetical protein IPH64_09790 [Comamonadaceae bacterium]|nr:hypothetical protein [Comamonadaceae bacterium]
MRIAQRVVAPAVDSDLAPAAAAGAVGAQRHVVAAVRQHQGRLDRGRARRHLAQQAARRAALRRWRRAPPAWPTPTSRGARSCSSDATASMAGAAMPQRCAQPSSSTLASATMLMPWWCAMKVPTRRDAFAVHLACRREVQRLDEAVARARAQRLQRGEV